MSDKFQSEVREDAWAPNLENELRDYLARWPSPNALGSTDVECRMTVCRVVAVVSDDVVRAVPMTDLQFAVFNLAHDSLGADVTYVSMSVMGDSKHPGQSIEVAFLRRADESDKSKP